MAEKKPRALFAEAGTEPEAAVAAPGQASKQKSSNRAKLRVWQVVLAVLVIGMVIVGGLTRLTDSGLSITEWNLVTGVLPPLSAESWQVEFAKYQQIPEFEANRPSMDEFKVIYWWEWGHRFLGRIVGLAFLIPFLYFLATKAIPAGWTKRLLIPGVLIGVQGVIGWWMVTSGLTERVDVAPYRLALHLGLAFIIFALLSWNAFCLSEEEHELLAARRRRFKPQLGFGGLTVALLFAQILVGAMVAGLDAGRGYTDWPLMQGSFLPPHMTPEAIWQFIHRMLGYAVLIVIGVFWWRCRKTGHPDVKFWGMVAILWGLAQVVWGIITLMGGAQWYHAIVHQLGALLLLWVMLRAMFAIAYPPEQKIARA
jgi:cytochrome c oxidase assembly protein subunit 15